MTIPDGYRAWQLVGVAQETGTLDELRAVVGNATALQAYAAGTLPFPDGTVLVKLAWKRRQSAEFAPAFVPGSADHRPGHGQGREALRGHGRLGFRALHRGQPVDEAQHRTCFACHSANVRDHDYVFTRQAP